jgi:hypothetical protein
VPNRQASGTSRLGFSTASEFCAADSMPRKAQSVSEMLEPMPAPSDSPCGFQAAAKVSLLNQNQPMNDSAPTGMITPQTVIEPILPVTLGPPKFATGREPQQRDHAHTGGDRRGRHAREEGREVAHRGDRDRDVADGQRQEVQEERPGSSRPFRTRLRSKPRRPPGRWLKMPACAKPYARAIEPSAVTIHESSEIAPTLAMLVGSMMIPSPSCSPLR